MPFWPPTKETEKIDQYLNLAREPTTTKKKKKGVEHEGEGNNNCSWCAWNGPQKLGNQREDGDHPDYSMGWEEPKYWEGSWKHEETCCHSNPSERSPANADVKRSQIIIIINFWERHINESSKLA